MARFATASAEQRREWEEATYAAVSRGEVGLILLAGGQGTRLGFNKPKGQYNLGLPSDRTLFALQAARIHRVRKLAQEATGSDGGSARVRVCVCVCVCARTHSPARTHASPQPSPPSRGT